MYSVVKRSKSSASIHIILESIKIQGIAIDIPIWTIIMVKQYISYGSEF